MKIQLKQIKIRDLTNQYKDLKSKGVVGYGVSIQEPGCSDLPAFNWGYIYLNKKKPGY